MPRKPAPNTEPPTTERLRSDIDSGKTDDKVRYPDPAAAPLGSDDEAAGAPPTERERRQAAESRKLTSEPSRRDPGALAAYVFLIVGVALVILAVAMVMLT